MGDAESDDLRHGNNETALPVHDTQLPLAARKTPLKDLPNVNNSFTPNSSGTFLSLKDGVTTQVPKVSGTKLTYPKSPVSPHHQPPSADGANSHLVYVRRKPESEVGKNNANETIDDNSDSPQLRKLGHHDRFVQPKAQMTEAKMQSLPVSLTGVSAGRPLVNRTVMGVTVDHSITSAIVPSGQTRINKQNWEERYLQLQMFLKKLDQSNLEDYLQMFRSLSGAELSRHAFELEKRAIQLSLEEGKELKRVKALNILGKSTGRTPGPRAPPVQQ